MILLACFSLTWMVGEKYGIEEERVRYGKDGKERFKLH